jgi:DNA-binding transcriptional LysR family regulator
MKLSTAYQPIFSATLVSFLRRNPEVELTIEIGMSGDLFRQPDERRYDLVFAKRLHGSGKERVVRSEPLIWCAGAQASGGIEGVGNGGLGCERLRALRGCRTV